MATPSFDLLDIIRTIQKQKKFIIIATLGAMALGTAFFLIRKKKFKATTHFLVTNPLYGDRNTLFRTHEQRYIDFFGGDDDIDRVMALLGSDTVKEKIIRKCQFQTVYNADINTPKGFAFLMNVYDKSVSIKRSEYKELSVTYTAYDSVTAANVANTSVEVVEEIYRSYYNNIKNGMITSINDKLKDLDSSINVLTDSLAHLREQYGIYSIINPARANIVVGDTKTGRGSGKGIEEIQNIESIKDQLVIDRAKYISLINEFSAATDKSMTFLKTTSRAIPPTSPSGPSLLIVLVAAGALGMFFSLMYALITGYYKMLMAIQR